MDKGKAESGIAPLEKDKANSFSLGLTHAGIIWSITDAILSIVIGLILQYS